MTLVDTNVLLDVFTRDPQWLAWSLAQLEEAALAGPLAINDVIYAETSTRYQNVDDFDAALATIGVTILPMSRIVLFVAGKAFTQYRRAGGIRTGVLSDFFVGAHAAVERLPLLTRDARRYRYYFPTVVSITPESE